MMVLKSLICASFLVMALEGQQISLKIGLLIPRNEPGIDPGLTFNNSAGAVITAIQRAQELGIYDPKLVNITFAWRHNQCSEDLTVGYQANLIYQEHVDAIMGPVCAPTSFVAGALSQYKNLPTFLWGPTAPADFYGRDKYPTTFAFAGTARGMFIALTNVMTAYKWNECAFLYTTANNMDSVCNFFADTFTVFSNQTDDINPVYIRQITDKTPKGFHTFLETLKSRARIIISCLESQDDKRNYMLAAIDSGIATNEYVHLFTQVTSDGFGSPPFWVGGKDGRDNEIATAAKTIVILDKFINRTQSRLSFLQDVADNIFEWPFYCKHCPKNGTASSLAVYLGDAMLAYLIALNKTYTKTKDITQLRNTTAIMAFFYQYIPDMPSITGSTYILNYGLRSARYTLIALNSTSQGYTWATIQSYIDATTPLTPNYKDESELWWARGGIRPVSLPACGFSNEKCPKSSLFYTVIVVSCIIGFFLIVATMITIIFIFQRQQRQRLNALWQIPHIFLQSLEEKENAKSVRSMRSIQTVQTVLSRETTNTNSSRSSSILRKTTDRTNFCYYNHCLVMVRQYPFLSRWTDAEEEEFRRMRSLDHENLNRFLGVATNGNICYMIWNYNERGSLMEVIKQHAFRIDSFIMMGMIKNIIEGLYYIHNSPFQQHGSLSVYRCVVGDRFEVKIQCYGLHGVKTRTTRTLNENIALFVAPEHLHGQQNIVGSQAGDVYSLGIICSVILTLRPAYGLEEEDDKRAGEIVQYVAKGKYPPVRPEIEMNPVIEVNHELLSLIKKMWSEHPPERPSIEDIRNTMSQRIFTNKSTNLMDYMFGLMENNAAELEQDVQQRTLELLEEQKKADILLYRMMPREAADCLKLGQTVTPEVYESSTVFFSDIVSFTVLASKSTPLQIINFLNEVYTLADSVIDKFDVYKVETIGDGMHVVSGVPKRNGTNHVKEICDMAIDFQRAAKTLRMSHLPDQPVQMRVGVHSGAAVAGIVGLTSPRYIVFGDTVNIAAKMEASGKAGRIHVSASTKSLIQAHFINRYTMVERGETLIKGIGPMHTHWVVPAEEVLNFQP